MTTTMAFEVLALHPLKDREKKHRASRYTVLAPDENAAKEAVAERSYRDVDFLIVRPLIGSTHVIGPDFFHYTVEQYTAIKARHAEAS